MGVLGILPLAPLKLPTAQSVEPAMILPSHVIGSRLWRIMGGRVTTPKKDYVIKEQPPMTVVSVFYECCQKLCLMFESVDNVSVGLSVTIVV